MITLYDSSNNVVMEGASVCDVFHGVGGLMDDRPELAALHSALFPMQLGNVAPGTYAVLDHSLVVP